MSTRVEQDFFIRSRDFEPAYLALYRSGALQRRTAAAIAALTSCRGCPRDCAVDRLHDKIGVCKTGRYARVSSHFAHLGEEDCLRGWAGSGTIFFGWCNLRCVFCQNFDVSWEGQGQTVRPERLAAMMLDLQAQGCHNINFVTPEHVVPQVLEALLLAVERGLRLPIVYNTSAYDALDSLRLLDGVVDIYMPDFKLWDPGLAQRYLRAKDYPDVARRVVREMHRQVGPLKLDERGLAKRGVLVRHLVMPGLVEDTAQIMQFVARDVSPDTYINIMSQYHPAGKVTGEKFSAINRRVRPSEYDAAVRSALDAGLWRLDGRRQLFARGWN